MNQKVQEEEKQEIKEMLTQFSLADKTNGYGYVRFAY